MEGCNGVCVVVLFSFGEYLCLKNLLGFLSSTDVRVLSCSSAASIDCVRGFFWEKLADVILSRRR